MLTYEIFNITFYLFDALTLTEDGRYIFTPPIISFPLFSTIRDPVRIEYTTQYLFDSAFTQCFYSVLFLKEYAIYLCDYIIFTKKNKLRCYISIEICCVYDYTNINLTILYIIHYLLHTWRVCEYKIHSFSVRFIRISKCLLEYLMQTGLIPFQCLLSIR